MGTIERAVRYYIWHRIFECYSVQTVTTSFIVFENFLILLILFSSSEYNYTISEFSGNLSVADSKSDFG